MMKRVEQCVFDRLQLANEDGTVNMDSVRALINTYNGPESGKEVILEVADFCYDYMNDVPAESQVATLMACVKRVQKVGCAAHDLRPQSEALALIFSMRAAKPCMEAVRQPALAVVARQKCMAEQADAMLSERLEALRAESAGRRRKRQAGRRGGGGGGGGPRGGGGGGGGPREDGGGGGGPRGGGGGGGGPRGGGGGGGGPREGGGGGGGPRGGGGGPREDGGGGGGPREGGDGGGGDGGGGGRRGGRRDPAERQQRVEELRERLTEVYGSLQEALERMHRSFLESARCVHEQLGSLDGNNVNVQKVKESIDASEGEEQMKEMMTAAVDVCAAVDPSVEAMTECVVGQVSLACPASGITQRMQGGAGGRRGGRGGRGGGRGAGRGGQVRPGRPGQLKRVKRPQPLP